MTQVIRLLMFFVIALAAWPIRARAADDTIRHNPFPAFPHVLSYQASVMLKMVGLTPKGLRVDIDILGGEVSGTLKGHLLPVGGDKAVIRFDCVGEMDFTGSIRTDDGADIEFDYRGTFDLGRNCLLILSGQLPPPPFIILEANMRFRTAHPNYLHLNRMFTVGAGMLNLRTFEVSYDVYEMRSQ